MVLLHTTITTLLDRDVMSELVEFQLTQDRVPLVLGWLLSARARAEMTRQLGPARKCQSTVGVENDCSYQTVVLDQSSAMARCVSGIVAYTPSDSTMQTVTYQKNHASWPAFFAHNAMYSAVPPKIATVTA